ncbi:MAG: M18 family aminopeptidase [Lachnospiraceae bacterium]|nr:M18 family aminopeptidase [Lachnospiraceae bacterium]
MSVLLDLLNRGKSPVQVVEYAGEYLEKKGFSSCDYREPFNMVPGGKYYIQPYPTMFVALAIGEDFKGEAAAVEGEPVIKLAMAHTDFPCFKLKSKPEYVTKGYLMANVEPYGGMIKSTWFDRPLGLAGKVVLSGQSVYQPKVITFDSRRPLFVIPSLAPHLDRDANKGHEYDMQTEMQPIVGMLQEQCNKEGFLQEYLAKELQVEPQEILSFDLFLYNMDEATPVGLDEEFVLSPGIDNLASVAALIESISSCHNGNGISMAVCYDNEEIGSRSKQGADSAMLMQLLDRVADALQIKPDVWRRVMTRGFLLSVDGAHGLHPNYTSKGDITNEVLLGKGPVIKTSASQRYISDSEGTAILMQLCRKHHIAYQIQVNRSGMPGGQTLGPIASSYLPWQGADLGVPMLAMHSANEMASTADWDALCDLIQAFFS